MAKVSYSTGLADTGDLDERRRQSGGKFGSRTQMRHRVAAPSLIAMPVWEVCKFLASHVDRVERSPRRQTILGGRIGAPPRRWVHYDTRAVSIGTP